MVIELFNLVVNNKKIIIDNDVVINDELLKTSTIRRLNNVHFNGYLDRLIDDTYELSGTLSGTMILPDDITLEDYEYNFTSSIDEKIDETRINFQKTIDITEDLWQNILVEIPLKCVNDKNKDLIRENLFKTISTEYYKLYNVFSAYEVDGINIATKIKDGWIDDTTKECLEVIYDGQDKDVRIGQILNKLTIIANEYSVYVNNKVFNH